MHARPVPASQAGALTKELDFVHRNVRSKLDQLKREELNRLRTLLKAKHAVAAETGGVGGCTTEVGQV